MIITAKASTVRSAAKRAGYDEALAIRSGMAAGRKEGQFVDHDECSVKIALCKHGVEEFFDSLAATYGRRLAGE